MAAFLGWLIEAEASFAKIHRVFYAIRKAGLDPTILGTHSMRSGGATAAANNGVSDRLFKRHGRGKSDRSKEGYVKYYLEARLFVSRSLGLG